MKLRYASLVSFLTSGTVAYLWGIISFPLTTFTTDIDTVCISVQYCIANSSKKLQVVVVFANASLWLEVGVGTGGGRHGNIIAAECSVAGGCTCTCILSEHYGNGIGIFALFCFFFGNLDKGFITYTYSTAAGTSDVSIILNDIFLGGITMGKVTKCFNLF